MRSYKRRRIRSSQGFRTGRGACIPRPERQLRTAHAVRARPRPVACCAAGSETSSRTSRVDSLLASPGSQHRVAALGQEQASLTVTSLSHGSLRLARTIVEQHVPLLNSCDPQALEPVRTSAPLPCGIADGCFNQTLTFQSGRQVRKPSPPSWAADVGPIISSSRASDSRKEGLRTEGVR